jgi:hypothetical protein
MYGFFREAIRPYRHHVAFGMILKHVFTVLQCSGLEGATGEDGRNVLLMMKADKPLGRAEKETRLPIGNESFNGKRRSQRLEAVFPETELPKGEAWEKERKTALAQIQTALKFRPVPAGRLNRFC